MKTRISFRAMAGLAKRTDLTRGPSIVGKSLSEMVKKPKNAIDLAKMIRSRLGEPNLRVAVFAEASGGWRAKVYADQGPVGDMQRRVDEAVSELNGIYMLET